MYNEKETVNLLNILYFVEKYKKKNLLRYLYNISTKYKIDSCFFDNTKYTDEFLCSELKNNSYDFIYVCKNVCKNEIEEIIIYKIIKKFIEDSSLEKSILENMEYMKL